MPLFGRRRRPRPASSTRRQRPEFQLLHPLATGPIELGDVPSSKANLLRDHLRRTRPEFIWACDDLNDLDVTVNRQFPTPAALVEAAFADQALREHYHVKRDGVPSRMLVILEPTFDKIATATKFRYLARHGADSNTSILVICSWLRPL